MPRDSSGVYTLAAGNPVVTGTVIESTWANTTMDDVAAALTDSLSRTGNGGMQVPLKLDDGTAGNPAYSFTNAPTSGMYWDNSLSKLGFSVSASEMLGITADRATFGGDSIVIPKGDTAARPDPPVEGMFRFNDETDDFEGYDGTQWKIVSSSKTLNRLQEIVTDPTKDTFTVDYIVGIGVDFWINGVKIEPAAYTAVDGLTVVLIDPAVQGDYIDIIAFSEFEVANCYTISQTDQLLDDLETQLQGEIAVVDAKVDAVEAKILYDNLLINGGMTFWARGISGSIPTGQFIYTADRWVSDSYGAAVSWLAGTHPISNNDYGSLLLQGAAGNTGFAARQRIESSVVETLVGKKVALHMMVYGNGLVGGETIDYSLTYPDVRDVWPAATAIQTEFGVPVVNGWSIHTFVFDALPAGVKNGLELSFFGSPLLGGQTIGFGVVNLVQGDVPMPMIPRHLAEELVMCQRYYETMAVVHSNVPSTHYATAFWKVKKRINPTLSVIQLGGSGAPTFAIAYSDGSSIYQSSAPTGVGTVQVIGDSEL